MMGRFHCPTCRTTRHVAEPGSGERIEGTGEEPTRDCCWWCGTPVPSRDEEHESFGVPPEAISPTARRPKREESRRNRKTYWIERARDRDDEIEQLRNDVEIAEAAFRNLASIDYELIEKAKARAIAAETRERELEDALEREQVHWTDEHERAEQALARVRELKEANRKLYQSWSDLTGDYTDLETALRELVEACERHTRRCADAQDEVEGEVGVVANRIRRSLLDSTEENEEPKWYEWPTEESK